MSSDSHSVAVHSGADATLDDKSIEAVAREMLRERIKATPWYRIGMSSKGRQRAIEREVDAYWHLFIPDAEKHLRASTEDDERQSSKSKSLG